MPELPDVEAFRRYFAAHALYKHIERVMVRDARLLDTSAKKVHEALEGSSFTETDRRGKRLFAHASRGEWLELHFGMSGSLLYFEAKEDRPDHIALEIGFERGGTLAVTSIRRLGSIDVTISPRQYAREHHLGPDALAISRDAFVSALAGRRGSIKGALINQAIVAGVGNIYADEILFQSRIHPRTPIEGLAEKDLREIWRVMRRVLRTASRHAPDACEMPEWWLIRSRHAGAQCPRCGGAIEKIDVSGRSTYLCPRCQTMPGLE